MQVLSISTTTSLPVGKLWVLAFMWMAPDIHHPPKHFFMAMALSNDHAPPPQHKDCTGNGPRNMTRESWRRWPGLKFPWSRTNWASMGCAGAILIHGVPTSQPTGQRGSAAKTVVPDTTEHCLKVPCQRLDGTVPRTIHGGASMNLTYSGTSHRWWIWLISGSFEARSMSSALCHISKAVLEQFLWCGALWWWEKHRCLGLLLPWGSVLGLHQYLVGCALSCKVSKQNTAL